jgi:hypothetical protein
MSTHDPEDGSEAGLSLAARIRRELVSRPIEPRLCEPPGAPLSEEPKRRDSLQQQTEWRCGQSIANPSLCRNP